MKWLLLCVCLLSAVVVLGCGTDAIDSQLNEDGSGVSGEDSDAVGDVDAGEDVDAGGNVDPGGDVDAGVDVSVVADCTHFMAIDGSDDAVGPDASPWAAFGRAFSEPLIPGDTLCVKPGLYTQRWSDRES